jgi:hypothetical protein
MLPFCFVWILVAIKNAANFDDASANPTIPVFVPNDTVAWIPFSYTDYVRAFQVERICTSRKESGLEISGLPERGRGWQVPFIKCNSKHCQYLGQDAQPFCEYNILVVTGAHADDIGGHARAAQFRNWMYSKWPVLQQRKSNRTATTRGAGMPFDHDFVQLFPDPATVDNYVKRSDYGTALVPKIGMSIVFDGNSSTAYKYWLRQNSTNLNSPERARESRPVSPSTPSTDRLFNSYAKTDMETCSREPGDPYLGLLQNSCTGQYLYNGVITTQRLIDDFILEDTGAASAGYRVSEAGVQFVQFPQQAFIPSGFFATVESTFVGENIFITTKLSIAA